MTTDTERAELIRNLVTQYVDACVMMRTSKTGSHEYHDAFSNADYLWVKIERELKSAALLAEDKAGGEPVAWALMWRGDPVNGRVYYSKDAADSVLLSFQETDGSASDWSLRPMSFADTRQQQPAQVAQPQAVPAGFVLVPERLPFDSEMRPVIARLCRAAEEGRCVLFDDFWDELLSAAPKEPT